MSHQPFENWIFTNGLTLEQHKALHEHLQGCSRCNLLLDNLRSMENHLRAAPLISPTAGFSQRWQANFAERIERQHHRQVRLLLVFISAAIILSLLIVALSIFAGGSLETWFFTLAKTLLSTLLSLNQFSLFFLAILRMLPLAIPIVLWILLTSGVALATLVWLASLWRISTQGVYIQ